MAVGLCIIDAAMRCIEGRIMAFRSGKKLPGPDRVCHAGNLIVAGIGSLSGPVLGVTYRF